MKKLIVAILMLGLAGCAGQAINQQDLQNVFAYAPPYTVAKLQGACTASSQNPSDKLLKAECVKLSVFAKGCELAIPAIASKVNTGLGVASVVVPQVNAVLLANQVAVPALEATQYQFCTDGGFLVGQPTPSPAATPAAK